MSDIISTASQMLARYPLFQVFSVDELERTARLGEVRHVAMGERIVRRGDVGEHVYLLLRGRVRFSRSLADGSRATLAVGTSGDLIGDEALTPPGRIEATCAAADSSELLRFTVPLLLDEICQRPAIDFRLDGLIRLHRLLRHLRNSQFVGFHESDDFRPLLQAVRPFRASPGTSLVIADQTSDDWHFVRAGICSRRDCRGSVGGIGPDECFGTEALIGLTNPATVSAVTSVSGIRLSRQDFDRPGDPASVKSGLHSLAAFTWIGQRGALDCGAAALAMASRRLGRRVSIEDVNRHVRPAERGTPLGALCQAAIAIGFSAQAIYASPESLSAANLPAIALLTSEHFLVVYEFGDHAVVGDPARGLLAMPRDKFLDQWTGHLLTLRGSLKVDKVEA